MLLELLGLQGFLVLAGILALERAGLREAARVLGDVLCSSGL